MSQLKKVNLVSAFSSSQKFKL